MIDMHQVKKHAEVVDANGLHVGTVDHVSGKRIKLAKNDSTDGHHHYIDAGLVAAIENGIVRLSATAANALILESRH